jgi:alpha-mannosidase
VPSPGVDAALGRLRAAADLVGAGWSPARWREVAEGGVEHDHAGFAGLDLAAGRPRSLTARLDPPAKLHGVTLTDDCLELTVTSIYPIEVAIDGDTVLAEPIPPVAAGPALLEVVKSLPAGWTGDLRATLRPRAGHGGSWPETWLSFSFTTPGLRARFEALDLAWAQLALADALASSPADRTAVEDAAGHVPDRPLDLDASALYAVLETMAARLDRFAPRAAALDVHVIGHAHIDLAWLWTWDDAREVIKRDIQTVLTIMRDYPEVTFTHSQPAGYEVIRRERPDLFAQIVRHVRDGRWEPATAQWVEGDTNLASGEALATQLLEGVTFTRDHLGVTPRVLLAPDTFGHSANLPQLAAAAGARVYYHHRGNPGAAAGRLWPAYWWEGLDGTRLLACSTDSYNGALTAGAVARAAIDAAAAGLPAALLFVGVGDHGGGPTRQGYDTLRRIAAAPGMPRARGSTLLAYADQIIGCGARLPVHRGESPAIFEGCYTTHADVKRLNRDTENALSTAGALAALAGLPSDPGLAEAWRDVCFHQFHDILDGSAIAEAYAATRTDHARVAEVAGHIRQTALAALTAGAPAGTVDVVNPHGHACTDVVTVPGLVPRHGHPVLVDASGRSVPGQVTSSGLVFVATVPGFGIARYCLDGGASDTGPSVEEGSRYIRVETPAFAAAVRRDCGIITSLVDKRVARQLVAFGMRRPSDYGDAARPDLGLNAFQIVDERPHAMSSWQYAEVHTEQTIVDGATTEVVERGPVRVVLRTSHTIRASSLVEDIIFYRDLPRIDFVAQVDWREPGDGKSGVPNLKVSFTADLDRSDAWFEVPYGAVRRRSNGQQVPGLRWADIGGSDYGIAVLNDAAYGHDVLGGRLRLTLVRTAYVPDPRSDHGPYTFRFSLVPHPGDWRQARIPHLAATFNQPLLVHASAEPDRLAGHRRWRPGVDPGDGLVTAGLRPARDGTGVVLRLAEAGGHPAVVHFRSLPAESTLWETDLTERRLRPARPARSVSLRPWEVRTLIIDDVEE